MQYRGLVQVAAKWLLAGFMPKHRTASIGPNRPAEKRPGEQSPFRNPPRPRLGTEFVKTEQHESDQVDQRKDREDVGQVEESGEVQVAFDLINGLW